MLQPLRSDVPLFRAARVLVAFWPVAAVVVGMMLLRNAWVAILLYHSGLVAGLAWSRRVGREGGSGSETPPAPRPAFRARTGFGAVDFAFAAALGAGAFVSVRLALPVLAGEEAALLWAGMAERLASYGLQGAALAVFAVYFVTVHPLVEETAWRGPLLGGGGLAPRWEDGAFALYHLPVLHGLFPGAWPLLATAGVALSAAAWFWRQRVRIDGGLGKVVLQHACADAGILAAVLVG